MADTKASPLSAPACPKSRRCSCARRRRLSPRARLPRVSRPPDPFSPSLVPRHVGLGPPRTLRLPSNFVPFRRCSNSLDGSDVRLPCSLSWEVRGLNPQASVNTANEPLNHLNVLLRSRQEAQMASALREGNSLRAGGTSRCAFSSRACGRLAAPRLRRCTVSSGCA